MLDTTVHGTVLEALGSGSNEERKKGEGKGTAEDGGLGAGVVLSLIHI